MCYYIDPGELINKLLEQPQSWDMEVCRQELYHNATSFPRKTDTDTQYIISREKVKHTVTRELILNQEQVCVCCKSLGT